MIGPFSLRFSSLDAMLNAAEALLDRDRYGGHRGQSRSRKI